MKAIIRTLAMGALFCAAIAAQTVHPTYIAFRESTLSAATEVITIQQPASPTKTVVFSEASVYCSVDCVVTVERDGTAATTTAFTAAAVSANTEDPTALAYRSSNAGSGTVLAKWTVTAGGTVGSDLTGMRLPKIAGRNVTFRISSITGTVRVGVKWTETN